MKSTRKIILTRTSGDCQTTCRWFLYRDFPRFERLQSDHSADADGQCCNGFFRSCVGRNRCKSSRIDRTSEVLFMLDQETIEKLNKLREKPMPTLNAEEIEKRKATSEQALANLKLEGLEVSPEYLADIEEFNQGHITFEEVLQRIKERLCL